MSLREGGGARQPYPSTSSPLARHAKPASIGEEGEHEHDGEHQGSRVVDAEREASSSGFSRMDGRSLWGRCPRAGEARQVVMEEAVKRYQGKLMLITLRGISRISVWNK